MSITVSAQGRMVKQHRYKAVITDEATGESVELRGTFARPDIAEGIGLLVAMQIERLRDDGRDHTEPHTRR